VEYDSCASFYTAGELLDTWLREIAISAEQRDTSKSIDVEETLTAVTDLAQWRFSWRRFLEANGKQKVAALLSVIKNRQPPWQFRMHAACLTFLNGAFRREVHAYYEVDHSSRVVVFTKFDGLPPGPAINDDA
jgi:hypothetical protein